jgi:hypothetical protein
VRPVLEEAAMLIELSMVEQRYLAVREALDSGATIVQVAAQYGVDRRTFSQLQLKHFCRLSCRVNPGVIQLHSDEPI